MLLIQIKILFIFTMVGCGSQHPVSSAPDIHYEINVTKSIDILKRELGKSFVESHVSKDKKNIFVQIKSTDVEFVHSLLHYDITTQSTPKLIKTIVDQNRGAILGINLLQKNKIIYVRTYKTPEYIRIYDYVLQKEIRAYDIHNGGDLKMSLDKMSFTKGGGKVDISDIYKDMLSAQQKIDRDDTNEVVVDSLNNLTWQDDISVVSDTYYLEDAINICKTKPNYDWRLPTLKDISTLMTQQSNPFSSVDFKNTTTKDYYWLQSVNESYNDSWAYDATDAIFIFSQTSGKKYVRCVTDTQSD